MAQSVSTQKKQLQKNAVPESARAAIEAAFRELKCEHVTDQETWLPIEFHEAMIELLTDDPLSMIVPDSFVPSKSATAKQLLKIKEHGAALLISMLSLQGRAIDALDFRNPTLGEFEAWLQRLVEAASRAEVPDTTNDRRGPKSKLQARRIAEATADHFSHLTGKLPARVNSRQRGKTMADGEFNDLLTKIFTALGVVASADRFGKEAIRVWTKKHQSMFK